MKGSETSLNTGCFDNESLRPVRASSLSKSLHALLIVFIQTARGDEQGIIMPYGCLLLVPSARNIVLARLLTVIVGNNLLVVFVDGGTHNAVSTFVANTKEHKPIITFCFITRVIVIWKVDEFV